MEWKKSYTKHIKRVLSCDFQITLKNGNIDVGGGECNFTLTIFFNCLLLQLPIKSSYIVYARITKPIYMIPLYIQMLVKYLKFFYVFQFWKNSDFSDFTQKCNFSVNYLGNLLKFLTCMGGGSHMQNISNTFYHGTFRSPSKMEILMEGA